MIDYTVHGPLKYLLFKIGLVEVNSLSLSLCQEEEETAEHLTVNALSFAEGGAFTRKGVFNSGGSKNGRSQKI